MTITTVRKSFCFCICAIHGTVKGLLAIASSTILEKKDTNVSEHMLLSIGLNHIIIYHIQSQFDDKHCAIVRVLAIFIPELRNLHVMVKHILLLGPFL